MGVQVQEIRRDDGPCPNSPFQISLFSSPVVNLEFANGTILNIHDQVLRRCPLLRSDPFAKSDLDKFSGTAGHALVEYLYTEKYNLLEWNGPALSFEEIELLELKTKLEIYRLARTVQVRGLEELAKHDFERAAQRLDIFRVIDAIKEAYPGPIRQDEWFRHWFKDFIKEAFNNPEKLPWLRDAAVCDLGDDTSVVKVLFQCMLETYFDKLEALTARNNAGGLHLHNDDNRELARSDRPHVTDESHVDYVIEGHQNAGDLNTSPGSDHEVSGKPRSSLVHEPRVYDGPEPEAELEPVPEYKIQEPYGFDTKLEALSPMAEIPSEPAFGHPELALEEAEEPAPVTDEPYDEAFTDSWSPKKRMTKKKKKKKAKKTTVEEKPALETSDTVPEVAFVQDAEPAVESIWDVYDSKTKGIKEKEPELEPESSPEPVPEPTPEPAPDGEFDPWGFWGVKDKRRRSSGH